MHDNLRLNVFDYIIATFLLNLSAGAVFGDWFCLMIISLFRLIPVAGL